MNAHDRRVIAHRVMQTIAQNSDDVTAWVVETETDDAEELCIKTYTDRYGTAIRVQVVSVPNPHIIVSADYMLLCDGPTVKARDVALTAARKI